MRGPSSPISSRIARGEKYITAEGLPAVASLELVDARDRGGVQRVAGEPVEPSAGKIATPPSATQRSSAARAASAPSRSIGDRLGSPRPHDDALDRRRGRGASRPARTPPPHAAPRPSAAWPAPTSSAIASALGRRVARSGRGSRRGPSAPATSASRGSQSRISGASPSHSASRDVGQVGDDEVEAAPAAASPRSKRHPVARARGARALLARDRRAPRARCPSRSPRAPGSSSAIASATAPTPVPTSSTRRRARARARPRPAARSRAAESARAGRPPARCRETPCGRGCRRPARGAAGAGPSRRTRARRRRVEPRPRARRPACARSQPGRLGEQQLGVEPRRSRRRPRASASVAARERVARPVGGRDRHGRRSGRRLGGLRLEPPALLLRGERLGELASSPPAPRRGCATVCLTRWSVTRPWGKL